MSSNGSGNGTSLRDRVSDRRNGNGGQGGEVARTDSLESQLKRMTDEYQLAMPKGMEAVQLVRDAITCLRMTKHLDKCDPASLLGSLMTCAQLGLRPAVLGQAWPLPYWDGRAGGYRAQLVIGYKGYIELGFRSGLISAVSGRVVWHGEKFSLVYHEDRDELCHEPAVDGMLTDIRSFYAVARMTNGGYSITKPWSLARMEWHRDKYAPRNREKQITGPWVSNFAEMGQKTVLIDLYKTLPKSTEMAIAIEADGGLRVNLEAKADAAEVTETVRVIPGEVEQQDQPAPAAPDGAASAATRPGADEVPLPPDPAERYGRPAGS